MPHRRTTGTEPMDRILLWAVRPQGQWSSISTELSKTDTEDDHPILRREVEAAVQSLKKDKSAGVDNIPAELVQAGGVDVITALTTIWNKIWQTGEGPTPLTQSLVITIRKKGNLQQCQNYRTIRLISHPSKVIWRSYWTDWSHRWRRSSLANRQASEQAGASQSRSSTHESSVRNISSTSKTSIIMMMMIGISCTDWERGLCTTHLHITN